jgi:L-iditol 2-dehydrogenase
MPDGGYADIYSPRKVLDDPSFRVLKSGEAPAPDANIAAFYNPNHEIHLVEKPRPTPGPGQVLVHVRSTGICGFVFASQHPERCVNAICGDQE